MTKEKKREYNRQYRKIHLNEIKKRQRQYYKDHSNEIRQRNKQYYYDNADSNKQYYCDNRKKKKQYRIDNAKKIKQYLKQYQIDNADKIKQWCVANSENRNRRQNARLKTDIQFRLSSLLRSRLYHALKSHQKAGSAVQDLGCTITEFKRHLESQFQPGMTWDNQGKSGWHLDHIIPLSKFNLQDRQQFLIANNYTNLQPMWAKDNLVKQDCSILDYRHGMF